MTKNADVPDEVEETARVTGASVDTVMKEYEAVAAMSRSTDDSDSDTDE